MLQIEISLRDLAGFVKHTGIEISMTLGYPDFESKLAMARSIGENDRLDFVKPVLKGRSMAFGREFVTPQDVWAQFPYVVIHRTI